MKQRIPMLALLGAAALMTSIHPTHAAEAKRPNVIFILTDDPGWGGAHFAGHPYVQTPHLDRFASQSTWFKQFHVAAIRTFGLVRWPGHLAAGRVDETSVISGVDCLQAVKSLPGCNV